MNPKNPLEPTRRAWTKAAGMAAAGVAAAGTLDSCARQPARLQAWAPVSIYRAATYSEELYDLVRRIIAEHALDVRGKRVVLKPNLVEFDAHTVINTNPKLVHAALEAFRAAGAADVRIAEGPGHRRVTLDLADASGYFATVPNFESLFTDLNLDETTKVNLVRPQSKLQSLYLPNTILGCDLLVSMPKLKTHHWAGATLEHEESVRGGAGRSVWMAQERAALGRHSPMHRRPARAISQDLRDRGRNRGHGRQRPHSGHAARRLAWWWRARVRWRWTPPAAVSWDWIRRASDTCSSRLVCRT